MVAKKVVAAKDTANENGTADQDSLGLTALAEGVLARDFRPRASTVRRLAEGILTLQNDISELKKASKKPASGKAKATAGKSAKKGGNKRRKLATIPGQKGK